MPRTLHISVAAEQTDAVVQELRGRSGITGLRVQRGICIDPSGDLVSLDLLNRSLPDVMQSLAARGIGGGTIHCITLDEPKAVTSPAHSNAIANDLSESNWEEMDLTLGRESNMTVNGIALMMIAGLIAVLGIASGTLHYVIAGMIIAPGFEPLARIGLGIAGSSGAWKRGIYHSAVAYCAVAAGAFAGALVLKITGGSSMHTKSTYHDASSLIALWSTVNMTSLLVSSAAAVAGGVLIASSRSVLTAGVMVGLSLVPAAALACMAIVDRDWSTASAAGTRWAVDVALVIALSLAVFAWKRAAVHRRAMAG